jgi:hypothetical protein
MQLSSNVPHLNASYGLDDLFHWYDNKKDVAVKIADMEI